MMFGFRTLMDGVTVEPDHESHDGCACIGVVSTLPDGSRILLDFGSIEALEAYGWALLGAAETLKATRAAGAIANEASRAP
jgi:hypothetical protein